MTHTAFIHHELVVRKKNDKRHQRQSSLF